MFKKRDTRKKDINQGVNGYALLPTELYGVDPEDRDYPEYIETDVNERIFHGLPPIGSAEAVINMSIRAMYEMPDDFPEFLEKKLRAEGKWGEEGNHILISPSDLIFESDEPSVFYPEESGILYRGQDAAKKRIEVYISGMEDNDRFKCLLIGTAGTGKTTLARIIAARVADERISRGLTEGRFFEIIPSQIASKEHLDALVMQLEDGDVVFIDEVHALELMEDLFKVLDDTGKGMYATAQGNMIEVPGSVSWITATTDPGHLEKHTGGALPRRLEPKIFLDAPSLEVLVEIIKDQPFPTHPEAAHEAARRSGGLPWQVKLLYEEAKRYARVSGEDQITPTHMNDAFEGMGLDVNGLLPQDRNVIAALLGITVKLRTTGEVLHKAGEVQLCEMAGVDRTTYNKRVQPKLLRLGLLNIRGGQCLTEKAVSMYGHLGPQ